GVGERTHEIGIRTALGASRSDVLGMVLRRGVLLTMAGIGSGLLGALAVGQFVQSLLYETAPHDPLTYVAMSAILAGAAVRGSYIPALRATRVDPSIALRVE